MSGISKHQDGKDKEMKPGQDLRQTFIIARKASKASQPSEAAFDYPSARQQHKPLFGLGQLNHAQFKTFLLSGLRGYFAGIALIRKSKFHSLSRGLLNRLPQRLNLGPFLFVGRRYMNSQ